MKYLVIATLVLLSSGSFATDFGDSYLGVKKASCVGNQGEIHVDIDSQTVEGHFLGERPMQVSFEPLKGQSPDFKVELIRDFLESGYDLLGSPAATKDLRSFGTFAIILDKFFENSKSQEMNILYVEGMTGWQIVFPATCSFD